LIPILIFLHKTRLDIIIFWNYPFIMINC